MNERGTFNENIIQQLRKTNSEQKYLSGYRKGHWLQRLRTFPEICWMI